MGRKNLIEAEAPILLSRANYDRTRKKFYDVVKYPRRDDLFPKLCPPGSWVARKITGFKKTSDNFYYYWHAEFNDPSSDFCVHASFFEAPADPIIYTLTDEAFSIWNARPHIKLLPSDGRMPDFAVKEGQYGSLLNPDDVHNKRRIGYPKEGDFVICDTVLYNKVQKLESLQSSTLSGTDTVDLSWMNSLYTMNWSSMWPSTAPRAIEKFMGTFPGFTRIIFANQSRASSLNDDWWYSTSYGQEKIQFVPPLARNMKLWNHPQLPGGYVTAKVVEIPENSSVWIRTPHDYIVGIDELLDKTEPLVLSHPLVSGTFGKLKSNFIILPARTGPFVETEGDCSPVQVGSAWMGLNVVPADESFLDTVVSDLARNVAIKVVIQAVGSAVTLGAGAPLISAGLQLASSVGATNLIEATTGVPVNTSTTGSSVTSTSASASQSAANSTVAMNTAPPPPIVTETIDAIAPSLPIAKEVTPQTAKAQTNQALSAIASISIYLDDVGALQSLYAMAFRELTIQAQTTKAAKQELRIKLATEQAKLQGQKWYPYAKAAIEVLKTIVTLGTSSALELGFTAFEQGLSTFMLNAAKTSLALWQQKEMMVASMIRMREGHAKQLQLLDKKKFEYISKIQELIRRRDAYNARMQQSSGGSGGGGGSGGANSSGGGGGESSTQQPKSSPQINIALIATAVAGAGAMIFLATRKNKR